MASLYKRPGSKKWYGRYRDENNIERRVPLHDNKSIAQRMLNDLANRSKRGGCGLLKDSVRAFKNHLDAKNNTSTYIAEVINKIEICATFNKWKTVSQFTEQGVEAFLLDLRQRQGRSIQTSNNYLRAIKSFTRWLARTRQLPFNPLDEISVLNTSTDRRHDRRPLTDEEFVHVIRIAETGPPRMGLLGRDRVMLYMLAAWTGFRKGELGSLTLRNFRLNIIPPIVTVDASYSKRRRKDTIILHPDIVTKLREWLPLRAPCNDREILFPISKKTCGVERKTSLMIQFDMDSARRFWIAETDDPEERQRRELSEFLLYENHDGLFADFHGLRHTFISNLGRAGVSPKTAQTLARHSDIKLTMNIYTHVDQDEQQAAINSLPKPPTTQGE